MGPWGQDARPHDSTVTAPGVAYVPLVVRPPARRTTPTGGHHRRLATVTRFRPDTLRPAVLVPLVLQPRPPAPRTAPRPAPAPPARPVPAPPVTAVPPPSVALPAPAAGGVEALLGETLAGVLGLDRVPADAHVFDELGADSMVMARFCARVRKRPDLPAVSMPDVYEHPTIAGLAAALAPAVTPLAPAAPPAPVPARTADDPSTGPGSTLRYVLCGATQLVFVLAYSYLFAILATWAYEWTTAAPGLTDLYLRSVVVGAVGFAGLSALPILVKWVLVGRWRPREFRVWGVAYVRFWIVKTLVRTGPPVLFAGSPLYALYLRALGARIGRGVAIFSGHVPVCTDLLAVGAGTVVRKDSYLSCYRAHAGRIQTGAVTLGRDVSVGEMTVLDIGTSVGNGASLAHTSALHTGQAVPPGACWHGSPARRTDVTPPTVGPASCGSPRRALYSAVVLALLLLVALPVSLGAMALLVREIPSITALLEPGPGALAGPLFYAETLALTFVLFVGTLLVGLVVVVGVPRVLARAVEPGRVYPLYGVHYWLHRAVASLTNVTAFTMLFGDSSAITGYLGRLGYRLRPLMQTGSNFGSAVKHESPFQVSVGRGTVVADGLSVVNADFSSTSFRVSPTSIGSHNFLGNNIAYPSQGRTGDDCLLATKVMVPVSGEVRTGVGLLGSPSFTIPRTVARDSGMGPTDAHGVPRGLAAKNRHNAVSIALHLLVRWLFFFGTALLVTRVASLDVTLGPAEVVLVEVLVLVFTAGWFTFVERCVTRLQARVPEGCSIYDPRFWRHERFWKVPSPRWVQLLNGTPFKNVAWRLLGARIGARMFDDGLTIIEKTFTTIGDDCTVNEGCVVQCHSQEDGAFKSDHVVIGAACTFGVGAFVHYGTTVGDGAVLAPDSFLMKGEEMPPGARWGGNPAREATTWSSDGRTGLGRAGAEGRR